MVGINFKGNDNSVLVKLMGINLLPYLFYFTVGALAYINWDALSSWYKGKGLIWLFIYGLYCFIFSYWLELFSTSYFPNFYGLIAILILSQTVLSLAITATNISKILNGNDISYGIYLYHMPVINVFIQLGDTRKTVFFLEALSAIVLLAFLSWKLIEKPILLLKSNPLKKINENIDHSRRSS